jgi:hypothetical protein
MSERSFVVFGRQLARGMSLIILETKDVRVNFSNKWAAPNLSIFNGCIPLPLIEY